MGRLSDIVRSTPVLSSLARALRNQYARYKLKSKPIDRVFTEIYENNRWGGEDSMSGTGSELEQTETIMRELPLLFKELGVASVLDIPCGDFHWMKEVDLSSVRYTGADIVEDLVRENNERFGSDERQFLQRNLVNDPLPPADAIFCRDCLVHLSFADVFSALNNICNSEAKYLVTTTFSERQRNRDIETGQWRPLNLEIAPFTFPKPLKLINEECTEKDGDFRDKAIGVWLIADLAKHVQR